jgi:hypothetical protein
MLAVRKGQKTCGGGRGRMRWISLLGERHWWEETVFCRNVLIGVQDAGT